MTEAQKKFVELEKKKEEVKKYFDDLQAAIAAVVKEDGVDSYFLADDGTVYKVVEAEGRWINFDKYSYLRTKRPGEERGTLSLKDAREHGFQVD